MMQRRQIKLISLLKTHERANMLYEVLSDVVSDSYKVRISPPREIQKGLSVDMQNDFFAFCEEEKIDIKNKKALLTAIQEMITEIPKLPQFILTIAIKPNYAIETFLFNEVSRIFSTPFLLDIRYDPDIVGGAIIQHNGRYKDYSIKKVLSSL